MNTLTKATAAYLLDLFCSPVSLHSQQKTIKGLSGAIYSNKRYNNKPYCICGYIRYANCVCFRIECHNLKHYPKRFHLKNNAISFYYKGNTPRNYRDTIDITKYFLKGILGEIEQFKKELYEII